MADIPIDDLPPPPVKDDNPPGFRPLGKGMMRIINSDDLWRDWTQSYYYVGSTTGGPLGLTVDDWGSRGQENGSMEQKWVSFAEANCKDGVGLNLGAFTINAELTDWEPSYWGTSKSFPKGVCLQKCPSGYEKKWVENNMKNMIDNNPGYWQCAFQPNVADAIADQILPHDPIEGSLILEPFEIEKLPYNLQAIAKADPNFMNNSVSYIIDVKRALGDEFIIYMDFQQSDYDSANIFLKAEIATYTPYKTFTTFTLDNRVLQDVTTHYPRIPIKRGFPPYYQSFQFIGVPSTEEIQAALDGLKRGEDLDAKFAEATLQALIDLQNAINNPQDHDRKDIPFTMTEIAIIGLFAAAFILF